MWAAAVGTMDPGQSIKINPSLCRSIHVNMVHARELPSQGVSLHHRTATYRIHLGNKQSSCRTTCCASRAQTMADHVGQMSASHKINELNHVKNKAKAKAPKQSLWLQSSFIKFICIWPRKPPAVDNKNSTQLHYVFYLIKHLRRTATHSYCNRTVASILTEKLIAHSSFCATLVWFGFFVMFLMHKQILRQFQLLIH